MVGARRKRIRRSARPASATSKATSGSATTSDGMPRAAGRGPDCDRAATRRASSGPVGASAARPGSLARRHLADSRPRAEAGLIAAGTWADPPAPRGAFDLEPLTGRRGHGHRRSRLEVRASDGDAPTAAGSRPRARASRPSACEGPGASSGSTGVVRLGRRRRAGRRARRRRRRGRRGRRLHYDGLLRDGRGWPQAAASRRAAAPRRPPGPVREGPAARGEAPPASAGGSESGSR